MNYRPNALKVIGRSVELTSLLLLRFAATWLLLELAYAAPQVLQVQFHPDSAEHASDQQHQHEGQATPQAHVAAADGVAQTQGPAQACQSRDDDWSVQQLPDSGQGQRANGGTESEQHVIHVRAPQASIAAESTAGGAA